MASEYKEPQKWVVERKKEFNDFVRFLEAETTWLTSPASTKYHLSEEGGLLKHSIGVTNTLLELRGVLTPEISRESCVIVALFHDIGKVGMPGKPRYLKQGDSYIL